MCVGRDVGKTWVAVDAAGIAQSREVPLLLCKAVEPW